MKRYLLAITLLLASVGGSMAQETMRMEKAPSARFGLFGDVDFALSSGDFTGVPGVSSCCPEYTSASDLGFLVGLAYIQPFNNLLAVNLRLHYWSYSTPFVSTETQPIVDLDGDPAQATIEHNLTGSFQHISVEPLISYRLVGDLQAMGGLTLGAAFNGSYDQKEVLVDPPDATFNNKSRERNVQQGSLPNLNVFAAGITLGLSYDLPLNEDRSIFISPEVLFTFSVLPHMQDVTWSTHHLRAGIALSFVPPAVDDSLTDVELYEFTKTVTPPTAVSPGVPFVAAVSHIGLTETGNPTDGSKIRIEEFASTRIRPVLSYVFFAPGSGELPSRYRRLNESQVESFSMANFYNLDAIVTYSHLLNIVGRRMTDDPSATITVTGCADPAEGTPDVAARRADAVKSYLTNTWGIAPGRINTNTRGLPEHPSRSSESDGLVENARVEITSSSPAILSPVESTDTMLITTPSGLRFKPSIDPTIPIAGYTLFIAQNGNLLKTFADGNPLPPGIDWRISESVPWIPKEAKEISYLVAVRDSSGIVVPSATTTVPVERITSAEKARSGGQDIRVDRYSLILFGFDEDNITPDHQGQVDEIKKRIQPNSTVKVIGYTDRTGDAAYNQSLSERRAKTVARALGQSDTVASGRGETLPLYDNNTPEGRFYSRTVEVLVETPRK